MEEKKQEEHYPPKLAQRFLMWFLKTRIAEEVQGDLDEMFYFRLERSTPLKAKLDYWYQVFNYLRPFAIRHIQPSHPTYLAMYQNYFKISLRVFAKNKLYLLSNTLGLGIALACCIVAYTMFAYNYEFDSFHEPQKVADIFRIHAMGINQSGNEWREVGAPIPLATEAAINFSGIEQYTRYADREGYIIQDNESKFQFFRFADSAFFEMFEFPLIKGEYDRFKNRNSIFISEDLSDKLFPDQNPLGQTLFIYFNNEKQLSVEVGGVLAKIPSNTTFNFDALLRFEHFLDVYDYSPNEWGEWRDPATFFKLSDPQLAPSISKQLEQYIPMRDQAKTDETVQSYQLVPFLSSYHSGEINSMYIDIRMPPEGLLMFLPMALMILLIACFNLTNTSLAMTSKRVKEIGVRKAIGAVRKQIFMQFLSETFLVLVFALILGSMISILLIDEFVSMVDWDYTREDLNGVNLVIAVVIAVFVTSLIAGTYPALYNSKLNPVALVKGTLKIKGTTWFSRVLLGGQFALSVVFLAGGIIFYRNLQYQENIHFGYEKDRLLTLAIDGKTDFEILKDQLRSHPKVDRVGVTNTHIHRSYGHFVDIGDKTFETLVMGVGENYMETVGLELIEGRLFNLPSDYDVTQTAIVNLAFLEKTGIEDPFTQQVVLNDKVRQIVGIVNSHRGNLQSFSEEQSVIYFPVVPEEYQMMAINAAPSDLEEIQEYIKSIWTENFSSRPFSSQYHDEIVMGNEREVHTVFNKICLFLTILGTILSLSGIFALTSLNITKRTKEIGVRKVLGASVKNIVNLINREFVIILAVSAFLGAMGGAFLTDMLISLIYPDHIPMGVISALLGAMIIFAVGYATTTSTILKAATGNPVESLRSE